MRSTSEPYDLCVLSREKRSLHVVLYNSLELPKYFPFFFCLCFVKDPTKDREAEFILQCIENFFEVGYELNFVSRNGVSISCFLLLEEAVSPIIATIALSGLLRSLLQYFKGFWRLLETTVGSSAVTAMA